MSSEHLEQVALFNILRRYEDKYPELKWVFAIPNGSYFHGHWGTIRKAIQEGLKSGVWDIFLPVAKPLPDDPCGLYIEMKYGKNTLTDNQKAFRDEVGDAYEWAVCYSAVEACHAIGEYLGIDELKGVE